MNQEQLQAIRERVKKATPGPWWDESGIIHAPHPENWSPDNHSCVHVARVDDELGENAEFIAHAREDVPALLDEIEALQNGSRGLSLLVETRDKEIERLRGALEFIQKHRMMVGEIAYIAARNALGNEGKSYAQIYGGQDDPTVAAIKEHRQALAGEST